MARRAFVEVVGDARSYLASLARSSQATRSFEGDLKGLATNARTTAEAQVQASLKRDARLRQDISAYKALAAEAKRGSREEVSASRLAAQAQERLARSTAVSAREQRALTSAAARYRTGVRGMERDTSRATRGILAGSGALRAMGRSLAFASAGFLGFAAGAQLIRSSVTAASNLYEQVNKVRVVLGPAATRQVTEWAEKAATGFGLAKDQAVEFIGTFAALLRPLGVARARAGDIAQTLTGLGSDLASFYNTDVADALQAIQSGLLGQARPLRRYGVALSEARVKAEAFASGLAKPTVNLDKLKIAGNAVSLAQGALTAALAKYGAGSRQALGAQNALSRAQLGLKTALAGNKTELTDGQKVLARYQLIMKDTALAQHDFQRTSGGLANQQRILQAQWRNLQEQLGQALLPTLLVTVKAFNRWLADSNHQRAVVQGFKGAVHGLGEGLKAAAALVVPVAHGLDAIAHALGGWKTTLELVAGAWVGMKVAAITSTVAISAANLAAAGVVSSAWKAALISTGWGALAVAAGAAAAYVITHWSKVKDFFHAFWLQLKVDFYTVLLKIAQGVDWLHRHLKISFPGLGTHSLVNDPEDALNEFTTKLFQAKHQQAAMAIAAGRKAAAKAKADADKDRKKDDTTAAKPLGDLSKQEKQALAAYQKALAEANKAAKDFKAGGTSAAAARAAAAKKAADAAAAKQFKFLGLGATGQAEAPPEGWLRRQLGMLEKAVKGTFLDTNAQQSLFRRLRTLLSGQLGALGTDVRGKLKEMLDGIKQRLADWQAKLADTKDALRGTLGELFAGPVLAPTEDQTKAMLGVPGPDPGKLARDLRAQTQQFVQFEANLARLRRRGGSAELIKELRGQGLAAAPEVAALAGASKGQLGTFLKAFNERERAIAAEAKRELRPRNVNIRTDRVVLTVGAAATRARDAARAGGDTTIVVQMDGREVAKATLPHQQRKRKRTVVQVRGKHAGDHVGVN